MEEVLRPDYPVLRYLAQLDQGDFLSPVRILLQEGEKKNLVLTFDEMLRRTPLAKRLSRMLQILEKGYHAPVDTEFTVRVVDPASAHPEVEISLLQCRPQSHIQENDARLPPHLNPDDVIFSTRRMAPEGRVGGIRFVLYVPARAYHALPTPSARGELGRVIGLLNAALKDEIFICVGPGRWGTSTPDLGVRVGYADIYNARALIELTGEGIGAAPEASFGTHFFQDLVESNIYPLAIYLNDEDVAFNRDFFDQTPNCLARFLPDQMAWKNSLRLIEVASYRPEHSLTLVMDDEAGKSVAYLERDQ
jgi:hypothetical protein